MRLARTTKEESNMSNSEKPQAGASSQDLLVRRNDLESICKAIEETHVRYQYDDNGPHTGWECIYCSGWVYECDEGRVEMRHDIDCPVLVARDIRPRQSPNASPSATTNPEASHGS